MAAIVNIALVAYTTDVANSSLVPANKGLNALKLCFYLGLVIVFHILV